jgi:hypothetical protein
MAADGARAENADAHGLEFPVCGFDGGNASVSTGLPRGATSDPGNSPASSVINPGGKITTKNQRPERLRMEKLSIIG